MITDDPVTAPAPTSPYLVPSSGSTAASSEQTVLDPQELPVPKTGPTPWATPDAVTPPPPQPEGWRIPLDWRPMDKCGITLQSGEVIYPYTGQGIWLLPGAPNALKMLYGELMALYGSLEGLRFRIGQNEPSPKELEKVEKMSLRMIELGGSMRVQLANVIGAWSVTDFRGRALPQPYENPEAFQTLSEEVLAWMAQRAMRAAEEVPQEEAEGN